MFTLTSVWAILASAVIALALYRKVAARGEDDMLHVRESEAAINAKQSALAKTLNRIDRWGKTLTVAVVLYGIVLLARFLYVGWEQAQQLNLT